MKYVWGTTIRVDGQLKIERRVNKERPTTISAHEGEKRERETANCLHVHTIKERKCTRRN